MRARLSMARSSGTHSPSANPFAAATDQLPVASARAPSAATTFAVPASQILNSTSGRPDTCSDRNVSALAVCADIVLFTHADQWSQFPVEFLPSLFGKEDPRALDPNIPPRPRYGGGEPVGPFHVEVDVVGAPGDQRGRVQLFELRLDRNGVGRIERGQEALEIVRALRRPQMRREINVDGFIRHPLRMLV